MTREQSTDELYEQSMRVECKMQEFRDAIKSLKALEEFNLASCIKDEDNSGTATGSSSSEWFVEEVLNIAFPTKQRKKEPSECTVRQCTPTIRTTASSSLVVSKCKRKAGEERDTVEHIRASKWEASVEPLLSPYPTSSRKGAALPVDFVALNRHWK